MGAGGKARYSIEQMLMQQAAAAHKLAMRFMAKADHQLSQVDTWNPGSYQAHSVEAARLAQAAGKLMGAFSDTVGPVAAERPEAGRPGDSPASGRGGRGQSSRSWNCERAT